MALMRFAEELRRARREARLRKRQDTDAEG
jgi:hypothetical protein